MQSWTIVSKSRIALLFVTRYRFSLTNYVPLYPKIETEHVHVETNATGLYGSVSLHRFFIGKYDYGEQRLSDLRQGYSSI